METKAWPGGLGGGSRNGRSIDQSFEVTADAEWGKLTKLEQSTPKDNRRPVETAIRTSEQLNVSGECYLSEDWAEYEALAHRILQELAPFAEVTHNDHIVGEESEARRQIDISVRWRHDEVDNLLIVQVKDHKRKADVNKVGEFRSVIQDVGAQRGILICSGGFSKKAMTYARNIGLQLWSLNDAKSKKWREELTIPVLRNQYTPVIDFTCQFMATVNNTTRGEVYTLAETDGVGTKKPFNVQTTFIDLWTAGEISREIGVEHEFDIDVELFLDGVAADGQPVVNNITDPRFKYTVEKKLYLGQLKPNDYRGIKDHLDGGFFLPTVVDLSIPPITDSSTWVPISNPDRVAVDLRGIFGIIEDARIVPTANGTVTVIDTTSGEDVFRV